jgi:hypothetical protein
MGRYFSVRIRKSVPPAASVWKLLSLVFAGYESPKVYAYATRLRGTY